MLHRAASSVPSARGLLRGQGPPRVWPFQTRDSLRVSPAHPCASSVAHLPLVSGFTASHRDFYFAKAFSQGVVAVCKFFFFGFHLISSEICGMPPLLIAEVSVSCMINLTKQEAPKAGPR